MGSVARHRLATLRAALDALFRAELPALTCQGLCADSCGPIGWTPQEAVLLQIQTGRPPTFRADLRCTYLDAAGRCEVYAQRPLICRLFGMVEAMRCKHGCVPTVWLPATEARALLAAVEALAGPTALPVPDASVPAWIRDQFRRAAALKREKAQ